MEVYEYSVDTAGLRRGLLLGFGALALYLVVTKEMPPEGWLLLAAGVVVVPYRLMRGMAKGVAVRIDAEGVCDRRLKVGVVRWEDIKRPYIGKTQGVPFLCLELRDPAAYRARMPASERLAHALYRPFGMKHVVIGTSHLDADAETILARVREGCARARGGAG